MNVAAGTIAGTEELLRVPDQEIQKHVARIITRAFDEARHKEQEKLRVKRSGLPMGGAVLSVTLALAEEAFAAAGARAIDETLESLESIYGTIPSDVVEWLHQELRKRFDSFAAGRTKSLTEEFSSVRAGAAARSIQEKMNRVAVSLKRDLDIAIEPRLFRARIRAVATGDLPSSSPGTRQVDVFICHASEDKADVAEPIAGELQNRGFTVWLDKFDIELGQSIFTKIDEGLRSCRFGVVILSPAFFTKRWTRRELAALAALEDAEGADKILPVWHNIDQAAVAAQSPLLAGLKAATTGEGIGPVVNQIAEKLARSNPE